MWLYLIVVYSVRSNKKLDEVDKYLATTHRDWVVANSYRKRACIIREVVAWNQSRLCTCDTFVDDDKWSSSILRIPIFWQWVQSDWRDSNKTMKWFRYGNNAVKYREKDDDNNESRIITNYWLVSEVNSRFIRLSRAQICTLFLGATLINSLSQKLYNARIIFRVC